MGGESTIQYSPIHGLVLAGGDSSRMGHDKGLIAYHGKSQREYLCDLLAPYTVSVFISCRPGQISQSHNPLIEDHYADLGPFGAVLSAFEFDAKVPWLVVACDFPLLDDSSIHQLVTERDPAALATCFLDPKSGLPEPWITIFEPTFFPVMQEYYHQNKTSVRGILQDSAVKLLKPYNQDILLNANTPEEAEYFRKYFDAN